MAIKLVINNKTKWSKRDLRKIILATIKDKIGEYDTRCWKVDIVHRKSHYGVMGRAYINSSSFKLFLNSPEYYKTEIYPEIEELIATTLHELDHCLGITHKEMADGANTCKNGLYNKNAIKIIENMGGKSQIRAITKD